MPGELDGISRIDDRMWWSAAHAQLRADTQNSFACAAE